MNPNAMDFIVSRPYFNICLSCLDCISEVGGRVQLGNQSFPVWGVGASEGVLLVAGTDGAKMCSCFGEPSMELVLAPQRSYRPAEKILVEMFLEYKIRSENVVARALIMKQMKT